MRFLTFEELSERAHVPEPRLRRHVRVHGDVIPSQKRQGKTVYPLQAVEVVRALEAGFFNEKGAKKLHRTRRATASELRESLGIRRADERRAAKILDTLGLLDRQVS